MTTAIHPLAVSPPEGAVLLICSDARLARRYIIGLASSGGPHQAPLETSVAQAESMLLDWTPRVIILDASCFQADFPADAPLDSLEPTVASLTGYAPVVVVASAEHRDALAFLIASGAVDLVVRSGNFVPVAVGLVLRRAQLSKMASSAPPFEGERARNFGETLRHEVNNPLTGILGNAEMLLKLRDELPQPVIARLETIAELAVRLRETIRRLSDCWEQQQGSAEAVQHPALFE
jgi:signal transduction histidine kinase